MKKLLFLLIVFAFVASCKEKKLPAPNAPKTFESSDFVVDIFKTIVNKEADEKNVILSPLSIKSAFLMAANGANGETRNQILSVLGMDNNDMDAINATYKSLLESLDYQDDTTRIAMANAVFWDNQRIQVKPEFLTTVADNYQAEQYQYDFSLPATKDDINGWVDEKTEGRIKKILDQISGDDVMFLMNALYFKADWKSGFSEDLTSNKDFTKSDGTVVSVPFMNNDWEYDAYANDEYQALDLKFKNDDFSMTFLMPKQKSINEFINDLTLEKLDDLYASKLESQRVILSLPKFEVSYKILLNQPLISLGMTLPFGNADFSNLGTAGGPLAIGQALHKTFLKIDEKGAEGAAVTSIGITTTSVPPPMVFNRPFVVILKNHKTNSYVFMAKIAEPK